MKKQNVSLTAILMCIGVFALLCLKSLLYQYTHVHQIGFADDAFYYFVVARHIVHDGISSFDGTTLTNGYHPLWMALLVVQFKALGQSLLTTRCIEYLLGEAALVLALLYVGLPSRLLNLFFTLGFFAVLSKTSFNGMETTLFAFCFALFTYVSERRSKETAGGGIVDGLLAAAVIAARIDAVVFVLPQILLATRSRYRKAVSIAVIMLCGVFYAVANKYYFGTAMPISGEIKSLGGLQANWALFHRLEQPSETTLWLSVIGILLIFGCIFVRKSRPYVSRHVVAAFLLGYLIFAIRLAFMSSWIIWPWYNYPLIIGYVACVPGILIMVRDGLEGWQVPQRLVHAAATAVILAVIGLGLFKSMNGSQHGERGALPMAGPDLPPALATTLDGAAVAMGDRAGNFAFHYPGSVSQLEGLMNDDQYLRRLKEKKDVKSLLCERKVRFVVAYEPDLTDYKVHLVYTIRPELSQYAAPEIPVLRTDQVVRISDYSSERPEDGLPYIYVWKLRCGVTSGSDSE